MINSSSYRSYFVLLILFLTSCADKDIEFLGCNWNIPYSFEKNEDGYYGQFNDKNVRIRFLNEENKLPEPEYFNHEDTIHHDRLRIELFTSNKKTPLEGIVFQVVTRNYYSGTVYVFNSNVDDFLINCNE